MHKIVTVQSDAHSAMITGLLVQHEHSFMPALFTAAGVGIAAALRCAS